MVLEVMATLTPIQKEVLTERYLAQGEKVKLATLGKKLNMTGERIRKIEFQAFKKMRMRLKKRTGLELE